MIRSVPATGSKAKSLAQQNTDFTAEGAPPPDTLPIAAQKTRQAASRGPAGVRTAQAAARVRKHE